MNELRRRLFEAYDTHYLRANERLGSESSLEAYRALIPEYEASYGQLIADFPRDSRIVDIGCGAGALLFWLYHRNPGYFKLTGVDLSERMLAVGKKNLPGSVEMVAQDAESFLRNNVGSFRAVFCTDVLEHIEGDNPLLGLVEAAGLALVPRGIFVCQVPNMANLASMQLRYLDLTHVRGFTELSLLQLLQCADLSDCRIVERKAVDASQWVRMRMERLLHLLVYRICGVANERHFSRTLVGVATKRQSENIAMLTAEARR